MGGLLSKLRDYFRDPASASIQPIDPDVPRISKMVVQTPAGGPETLEQATAELTQARILGSANLFGLNRERTALEALVSELRK